MLGHRSVNVKIRHESRMLGPDGPRTLDAGIGEGDDLMNLGAGIPFFQKI